MSQETSETPDKTPVPPLLDPIEVRILGCLMEKQRTTPDSYPLTLNALVQACNQKTSRYSVMRLEQGKVGGVLNQLRDKGLIHASFSVRVERYDHKMASSYRLDRQQQALMCTLMLRGPQTGGELRTNAGRLAEFPDLETLEEILMGLEEREPPLVVSLPRLPGKREERHAHLLSGDVDQELPKSPAQTTDIAEGDRLMELETEVARLSKELEALWELTGLSPKRPTG